MIHPADLRLAHGTTTSQIIGAFYDVYNGVGFGYGESVYANAMAIALAERGVSFQRDVALAVRYRGEVVGEFRADLIAERRVLVEYKVADKVVAAHEGQVVNYLRASGLRVGLILNFGATAAVRRVMWTANRAEPTDGEGACSEPTERSPLADERGTALRRAGDPSWNGGHARA